MKLHKALTVAGKAYALVNETLILDLFTPGRAVLTVQSPEPLTGVVIFAAGYHPYDIQPWFI